MHTDYDGFGRRLEVTDSRNAGDRIGGSGVLAWDVDAMGRVTEATDQDGWRIGYDWRADGQRRRTRVFDPYEVLRYDVLYGYDMAARLRDVQEPLLDADPNQTWIARLDYDDNGNRSSLSYWRQGTLAGACTRLDYSYNDDNRLSGYSTTGGPTFSLSGTTVDGLGRLRAAGEVLTDTSGNPRTHVHGYAYDMRSQLTDASITNGK